MRLPACHPLHRTGVAWDPDGLLPPPSSEGHFARRARQKAAAAGAKMQEAGAIRPIPPEHLAAGGVPAADGSLYDRPAFEVGAAFSSCRLRAAAAVGLA